MKKVRDLVEAMGQIAPLDAAEPWDNVGLIVGDASADVARVMLCIDLTPAVVEEAVRTGAQAVVAYHPPMFKDVRKLVAGEPAFEAIRKGVAVYTPHTALDVAEGGTNDVLADALYLTERHPLRPGTSKEQLKLSVFVPEDAVDRVADAIFDAGGGGIGDYTRCSFRTAGQGTFLPGDAASPAIGESGRIERVEEVRLETIVPRPCVAQVLAAMIEAHPYEEPAFDLLVREAPPTPVGLGRIGDFEEPVPRDVLLGRIRRELEVNHLLVAGPQDGDVRRVAVCAGSCGDLLDDAARQGAGLYLTGELKHHDALRAQRLGMTVVCVLHSNSERPALRRLRSRLGDLLEGVDVLLSETDFDPFQIL